MFQFKQAVVSKYYIVETSEDEREGFGKILEDEALTDCKKIDKVKESQSLQESNKSKKFE